MRPKLNPLWVVHKFLLKGASICSKLAHSIYKSPIEKWRQDNGDQTLRLNYNLNKDSLVFDVGGYEGQWAQDIYDKYHCSIIIFEPVKEFAEIMKKKFGQNRDIGIYQFGLSDKADFLEITVNANASSIFNGDGPREKIQMVKASDFLKENSINNIDLMKINIEGGEYPLLDNLIDTGSIKNIKNIQVQFHNFVPQAEEKMKNIQNKLRLTHRLTYQYHFVWENWERKSTHS